MSSTQGELRTSEETPLKTMWFETHLGVRYEMPDMLREHITFAHEQLDAAGEGSITVINVSEVVALLPKRIINKAGVGDRCFWESK